jgi:hypothetical protein
VNISKKAMTIVAVLLVFVIVTILVASYVASTNNEEVRLRNAIEAKQRDSVNEYDALWKKINQAVQVTDAHRKALLEVLSAYVAARGTSSGGAVVKWIHEAAPNVDPDTFRNLQNIITGSRDTFAMRQRELLSLKAQHDTLLESFPSGPILSMFGREKIEVTIVTSTKAEETFTRGIDDDVDLPFEKK